MPPAGSCYACSMNESSCVLLILIKVTHAACWRPPLPRYQHPDDLSPISLLLSRHTTCSAPPSTTCTWFCRSCVFAKDDVSAFLRAALEAGQAWDVVILDPPKLAPSRYKFNGCCHVTFSPISSSCYCIDLNAVEMVSRLPAQLLFAHNYTPVCLMI